MTAIVKCQECGGLFSFLPRGVCVGCLDRIEQDYRTVRSYLRDNPGARVLQVAEATEVEEGRIQRLIADGRIELATSDSGDLTCEVCGTTITGGRHCEPCRRRLVAGLNQTLETPAPVNRLGMHSRDR